MLAAVSPAVVQPAQAAGVTDTEIRIGHHALYRAIAAFASIGRLKPPIST